jgi:hypothetical protein
MSAVAAGDLRERLATATSGLRWRPLGIALSIAVIDNPATPYPS